MSDDETRREDARIEAAIDRALKHGLAGECSRCSRITYYLTEDLDTGEKFWLCRPCAKVVGRTGRWA